MKEERRRTWLTSIVLVTVLLAGTIYWGYTQFRQKQQLLTYLNNRNQKAFFELVDEVENMEVMLAKCVVSSSPEQKKMLMSDIWLQANSAQGNLGALPVSQPQIARTAKFFTQVGDYSYTLGKKLAANKSLTEKEEDRLEGLHTEAGYLLTELQKIRARAADGTLTWNEVKVQVPKTNKADMYSFVDGISRVDKDMQRYPTLIYDGPFSDHIELMSPKGLTGSRISSDKAKEIAGEVLKQGNKPLFKATRVESIPGKIPAYRVHFDSTTDNGPRAIVDISRKGGHVVMMMVSRASGGKNITLQAAQNKASDYLEKRGLKNMVPTYTLVQNDTAVISYAYEQQGVRVYPDLIKVKVAMDNGDVIGVEALGYLMSHHVREIQEPKVSQEKARKAVNPRLKVQNTRLVVIPTDTLGEKLCYEFNGTLNGDPFIVYIDAMTGREEQILKVIDTKDGIMTM